MCEEGIKKKKTTQSLIFLISDHGKELMLKMGRKKTGMDHPLILCTERSARE